MEDSEYRCRHNGCEDTYNHKTNRKRYEKSCKHKSIDIVIEKPVNVFYCSKHCCSKSFQTKFNCKRHELTCS